MVYEIERASKSNDKAKLIDSINKILVHSLSANKYVDREMDEIA